MPQPELSNCAVLAYLLALLLLLPPGATAQTCGVEGAWVPVDQEQAPTLYVAESRVYELEQEKQKCTIQATKVEWDGHTAFAVEGDPARDEREKWRFSLSPNGGTAIVRSPFYPITYRRKQSRALLENCIVQSEGLQRPLKDSIP